MKRTADWRIFEKLVERIQRSLNPGARIDADQRLPGLDSGGLRQIDIVIRQRIGVTEILLIVDCKQKSRKTDMKEMEEFIGLKRDVRAHAGIIVSEKGFSKRALRLARQNHIEAFTVAQTVKDSWEVSLSASILVEEWVLIPRLFRLVKGDGSTVDILDDRQLELISTRDGRELVPAALIQKIWNDLPEKREGKFQNAFPIEGHASIIKFVVAFESEVQRATRPGILRLIGLTNAETNLTFANDLRFITTSTSGASITARPVFSAFVRTTLVKTIQRPDSGLNLTSSWISIDLETQKPQSFNLQQLKQSRV